METMELRRAIRYPVAALVVFKWKDRAGGLARGTGVTRDISVTGAFIMTPDCPPPGSTLTVEIFLPHFENHGQSMRMVTEGRVMRVERSILGESQDGFVVVTEGFAIPELANRN